MNLGTVMSFERQTRIGVVTLIFYRWILRSCGQEICEADNFGNCPFLAREGKCATGIDDERTSAWVVQRCPLSCKKNDCFDPCNDLVPQCLEWERQGKCFHNADFMLKNCRKTCNIYPCKARNRPFHSRDWIAGKATELNTRGYSHKKMLLENLANSIYRRDPSLGSFFISNQKVRASPWLYLSNLGLELAGGEATDIADYKMERALATGVLQGINVIATTISDRDQRSEMNVGWALRAVAKFNISRSDLFISSRAGFLPRDPFQSGSLKWWEQLKKNGTNPENFVDNHCILPECLQRSLEKTLSNIGISTLDVLFLEMPAEAQLGKIKREEFISRLKVAFKFLEDRRRIGMVQSYGISTRDCLLRDPTDRLHLGLQEVVDIAKEVGGIDHGFRYIQVPVTAALPTL